METSMNEIKDIYGMLEFGQSREVKLLICRC